MMKNTSDLPQKIYGRWLKLTAPVLGTVPATGYWATGKEYYQHYAGQLPELEYHICYPAHRITYHLPRTISPEIDVYFLQRTQRNSSEAYWLTVPNSTILRAHRSMGSVIAHDGKVIHDSSRQIWVKPEENEAIHLKFPTCQTVDGCIAVTTDGGGGLNYWHWLLDILPRVYLLKHGDIWSKVDYFLIDKPFPKMLMALAILGVQEHQIIWTQYGHSLRTRLTIVPQFIQEKTNWIVNFLREYFLPYADNSLVASPKVYISRKKASRRRILNEDQVLDYLIPRGYMPCYLEDLSFPEQIALFKTARYVIGLHGAGLTNIIWCETGGRVLEIFPDVPWRDCYWILANEAGLDYYYWYPTAQKESKTASYDDEIVIDMEEFAQAVEHFES